MKILDPKSHEDISSEQVGKNAREEPMNSLFHPGFIMEPWNI
jgi:hypothetical protein